MGMNPDTNELQGLVDQEAVDEFMDRFYAGRPPSDTPIFEMREEIIVRGYVWQVIQMTENRLVLQPLRNATKEEIANAK